ncbi:Poly [ADP-ribose] polymerase tankyrase [Gryllus bimaculatus]|nr:Poly [ADP-ribose] polymerase tankyrase [Gryllus bimaculatus]
MFVLGDNNTKERILNHPLSEEGTFLFLATKLNQGDVVRTLLSCGADPGVQNDRMMNAVDAATTPQMRQIYVEELLRATANSEVGRVCQLIAAGISINAWDSEESKNTPLHWAACYGNQDIVVCLLDRGADVNAMNACGATPLHDAVFRGDVDVARALLQSGANPLIQALKGKFGGKTALDLASHNPKVWTLVESFTNYSNHNHNHHGSSGDRVSHHSDSLSTGGVPDAAEHRRRGRSTSVESFASGDAPEPGVTFQERISAHSAVVFSSQASSLDLSPRIDQAIESLVRAHIRAPVRPLVTRPGLHLLWPQPLRIEELGGAPFLPRKQLEIAVVPSDTSIHRVLDVWEVSRPALLSLGYDVKVSEGPPGGTASGRPEPWPAHQVECWVSEGLAPMRDSYQMHINSERVQIRADSLAGLHYAVCTLTQLLRLSPELVPVLIEDQPALSHRGILLDVSPRGRDYLFHMINLWSSMKMNYLHLYTRLLPGPDYQLCFSGRQMITLDRYCQDRFMSLLPVLDVDASVTLDDLDDMWPAFREVVSTFPNASCVHLGPALAGLLLSRPGDDAEEEEEEDAAAASALPPAVPLAELWQLLGAAPAATLFVCSNGLGRRPPPPALPPKMVLVQYGFQADYDFLEWAQQFRRHGALTCLCPGTASWNSLAGCPEAAVCNVYLAIQAAVELRSLGIVVAHWSGSYHLTPHPFSWPGFVVAAGLAWNPSTHWDYLHNTLADLLNTHVFMDPGGVTGRAIMDLGHAETFTVRAARAQEPGDVQDLPPQEGSTLYQLLCDPDGVALDHLTSDVFARVAKHIKKVQHSLLRADVTAPGSEMVLQELQLAADLMLTSVRIGRTLIAVGTNPNSNMGLAVINLGVCNLPPTFRTDIANNYWLSLKQYKGTCFHESPFRTTRFFACLNSCTPFALFPDEFQNIRSPGEPPFDVGTSTFWTTGSE